MTLHVAIKRLPNAEGLPLPVYATQLAAGADVCSAEEVALAPGAWRAVATGFAYAIPEGFEMQVRPRSGLASKQGVTVLNAPGTIDADYRGELKVLLINHGQEPFLVTRGQRIAQVVIAPVARATFGEVSDLGQTQRGHGGFGSTGR